MEKASWVEMVEGCWCISSRASFLCQNSARWGYHEKWLPLCPAFPLSTGDKVLNSCTRICAGYKWIGCSGVWVIGVSLWMLGLEMNSPVCVVGEGKRVWFRNLVLSVVIIKLGINNRVQIWLCNWLCKVGSWSGLRICFKSTSAKRLLKSLWMKCTTIYVAPSLLWL